MKILVVDDNPDAAEALKELMESEGHSVHIADCGEEAVDAYQQHEYRMVFMDLKMPGMGGAAAIREILGLDPSARLIVITGNTVEEEINSVKALGIMDLLRKPYDPCYVIGLVNNQTPGEA